MSRFFVSSDAVESEKGRVTITGEDVRHIKNVLRSACGDELTVSDGCGNDYAVVIESFEKDKIITGIVEKKRNVTESPIEVTLYQGIPKHDRMDYIIQKCIELGVNRIVPVITARTVVRFDGPKDMASKTARWQRIGLEAAKQCDRGLVPEIGQPLQFGRALEASVGDNLRIIPYEEEKSSGLKEFLRGASARRLSVYIGPEGGFSEKEIESAVRCGIQPVTLGPRILRTDTAGPAVLSILMFELGDMG